LFEEVGGNPEQITFATKQMGSVSAYVSESYPPHVDLRNSDAESGGQVGPVIFLECLYPQVISSIEIASFGTPQGNCTSNYALSIAQKVLSCFLFK